MTRDELEEACRALGDALSQSLPRLLGKQVGFALIIGEFSEKRHMAYVSNVERSDMVKLVEEWLEYQKAGISTDPRGPRAQG